jgi:uncharacterized protein
MDQDQVTPFFGVDIAAAGRGPRRRDLLGLAAGAALLGTACTTTPTVAPTQGMAISKTPLVGKFVWRDLMTDDPALVKPFYAALFGWEFVETKSLDRPYTLIKSGGQFIGGIAKGQRRVVHESNAQWLSFLSVADVDRAAQATAAAGGSVLVAPLDFPKVGRAAVVTDPQGAPLGLLRASFGDPADTPAPVLHRFLWTEALVGDPVAAARFYADLVGYEVLVHDEGDKPFRVLKLQGRERAGIMRMPFANMQPTWLPSVMVTDPAASAQRAASLGGRTLVAPRMDVRAGSVALIVDPGGALLALQRWPT